MSTEMVRCPWTSFYGHYFDYKLSDVDIESCVNELVKVKYLTQGDKLSWSWGVDNPDKLYENNFFNSLVTICNYLGSLTLSDGRKAMFQLLHKPNSTPLSTIDGGNHRLDGCIYPISANEYTMYNIAVAAEYKLWEADVFQVRAPCLGLHTLTTRLESSSTSRKCDLCHG